MKQFFLFILFLICVVTAESQSSPYCINGRFAENDFFGPVVIESDLDVLYGLNVNLSGNVDSLRLNVFYPNKLVDGLSARPLVIMIHGGGFNGGSRTDLNNYCEQLARRGYVAATVDYRLGWDSGLSGMCDGNINQFKNAIYKGVQDVNASIRYLTYHATDYDIDTGFIFLAGQSEGGLLALHSTFMQQPEANMLFPGVSADLGTLNTSTNTIVTNYSIKGVFNWCGGMLDTSIIQANEKIPVLSIHGSLDSVMPLISGPYTYCQSTSNPYPLIYGPTAISQCLKHAGSCSETNYDENGMHCNFPSLDPLVYIPSKFTCFFKNMLCGNCVTTDKVGYNFKTCMDAAPVGLAAPVNYQDPLIRYDANTNTVSIYAESHSATNFNFKLYTLSGQLLYSYQHHGLINGYYKDQIKLPFQLSKAVYLVRFEFGNRMKSMKLIAK